MGFYDARRFKRSFEELFPMELDKLPKDQTVCLTAEQLEQLYNKGFQDGAQAQADYDPHWDAD